MKYQKREREKMAIVVSRSFFFEYSCSDLCTFSFSLLLYPPPIRTRAFSSSLSRSVLLAPFLTGSRTRRRSLIVFFFFFSPFLSFFLFHRSEQGDASNEVRRIEMCTPSAFRLLHSTRGRFVPGIESRTRMKD